MPFTDYEIRFINWHGLDREDVYDGRYQSKDDRHDGAKSQGKYLILSSVRCRAAGHRIRTRANYSRSALQRQEKACPRDATSNQGKADFFATRTKPEPRPGQRGVGRARVIAVAVENDDARGAFAPCGFL